MSKNHHLIPLKWKAMITHRLGFSQVKMCIKFGSICPFELKYLINLTSFKSRVDTITITSFKPRTQ